MHRSRRQTMISSLLLVSFTLCTLLLLQITKTKLIYLTELSTPSSSIIPSTGTFSWIKYPWTVGGYAPSGARAAHVAGEDIRQRYSELLGDPERPMVKGTVSYSACRDKRCYSESTIKALALMKTPKDNTSLPFDNNDPKLLPGNLKQFGFNQSTVDFNTSLPGGFCLFQNSASNSIYDIGLDLRLCKYGRYRQNLSITATEAYLKTKNPAYIGYIKAAVVDAAQTFKLAIPKDQQENPPLTLCRSVSELALLDFRNNRNSEYSLDRPSAAFKTLVNCYTAGILAAVNNVGLQQAISSTYMLSVLDQLQTVAASKQIEATKPLVHLTADRPETILAVLLTFGLADGDCILQDLLANQLTASCFKLHHSPTTLMFELHQDGGQHSVVIRLDGMAVDFCATEQSGRHPNHACDLAAFEQRVQLLTLAQFEDWCVQPTSAEFDKYDRIAYPEDSGSDDVIDPNSHKKDEEQQRELSLIYFWEMFTFAVLALMVVAAGIAWFGFQMIDKQKQARLNRRLMGDKLAAGRNQLKDSLQVSDNTL